MLAHCSARNRDWKDKYNLCEKDADENIFLNVKETAKDIVNPSKALVILPTHLLYHSRHFWKSQDWEESAGCGNPVQFISIIQQKYGLYSNP